MSPDFLAGLLQSTLMMAVPLLLAAQGELLAESAGVVNIGLEGMVLTGAFVGLVISHATLWPVLGLVGACLAGVFLAVLFASVVVQRGGNQIVVGTAINLLAAGLTGIAYRAVFGVTGAALTIDGFPLVRLPFLSEIPVVGESLFSLPWLGYVALLLVPLLSYFLRNTTAGLKLRMVGENPRAAAAQGVSVRFTQTMGLIGCGVLAGAAGAYLSIAYARTFVEGMSAGRGFVALAIVIFGRWSSWGVLGAAFLFGSATALQFQVQALGLPIPYQFPLMLPYVLTLLVLAGYAGTTRPPAALGAPLE